MTEDADRSSKTEEPTEKKLSDARNKGNVPHSREVVNAVGLAGSVCNGLFPTIGGLRPSSNLGGDVVGCRHLFDHTSSDHQSIGGD